MPNDTHDTLVYRLAQILIKLNQGEKLDPQRLADEFCVNLRTIQRDLNERFAYLPLQKANGRYFLDPVFLGKLSTRDVERFASLAGVKGLFPSLSNDFLRDIFDSRIQEALLVKGHNYEDLGDRERDFRELERAITKRRQVAIDYRKGEQSKHYASLDPYKLINHKGIWYLAVVDGVKVKVFSVSKIGRIEVLDTEFAWSGDVDARLAAEDGIWFSEQPITVRLWVSPEVAGYFKRRKLIANQVIEEERPDGSLLLATRVGHAQQVLPIVRYWMPHLHILEPALLLSELKAGIEGYLSAIRQGLPR
jgi:predicted DNA-binding transcriptional regulator YafY